MRILIVAKETDSIQQLERTLKTLDAGFEEEPGTGEGLDLNIEQMIRESALDWILIDKQGIIRTSDLVHNGADNNKVPMTISGKYLFKTLRLTNKINKEDFEMSAGRMLSTYDVNLVPNEVNGSHAASKEKIEKISPVQKYRQRFLVRQGQRFHSIDIKDIAYFFSEDRFIFMKTKENLKFLFEYRMDELEHMLDPNLFFRVNRAFFISISSIDQVSVYPGNRLKLQVKPASEKEIIVSRERVSSFRVWLGE